MEEAIIKALSWRYATQVFDQEKKLSDDMLKTILESGRMAPSSYGIEPWKFIIITNKELRAKLREVSFGQPKVTDAPYLVVIARRTDVRENIVRELIGRTAKASGKSAADLDGLKQMVDGVIASRSDEVLDAWAKAQTYIALGMMIETAALLGVDAGPMEGFVPDQVDEVLGLKAKHLTATTMLALGYRGEDAAAARPKARRTFDEAVEFIR
jgi:nitroreductase